MSTRKEPSNPAKINIAHVLSFFQGYTRKFSETFGLLEDYKREQVIWRSELAKECTENGSCTFCGCHTPAKYYADDACEKEGCYVAMMSKDEWEQFKKSNSITIKID